MSQPSQLVQAACDYDQTVECAVLRCGTKMPLMGFGTFKLRDEQCVAAVRSALELGYRLIDTASMYKNQAAIAEGIRQSGIPRESIFISSKVRVAVCICSVEGWMDRFLQRIMANRQHTNVVLMS